jgi:hypothetical protein
MIDEPEALSNAPNSPELDGKYLGQISSDFAKVSELVKEAAYQIRKRGFSEFPIFATSRQELPLGTLLLGAFEQDNDWHYYASFLEEFTQRQIIAPDAVDYFRENYKNPEEFACLFVVDADFTRFVFIPYPED